MSAALVLMITDGQDTQKRTEDLQQARYAIGPDPGILRLCPVAGRAGVTSPVIPGGRCRPSSPCGHTGSLVAARDRLG